MRKTTLLLYSGGVDSMVCLKRLVKNGIVPFIFHFKVQKFKRKHERMIRKSAKLLSPKSPFYVFETGTIGFQARYGGKKRGRYTYTVKVGKKDFNPLEYADKIVVGYHKYAGRFRKGVHIVPQGQKEFIGWVKKHRLRITFPLENYTPYKIDREFEKFPVKLQKLAISTTRGWFKGTFLPTEKKVIE
jgi:hypothetical protein